MDILTAIEQWIDEVNHKYKYKRVCCTQFAAQFAGFYPTEFLENAFYVVIDEIPKPDFAALRAMGLGDFIDMKVSGITYKNTYYLLPTSVDNLRVHFHELVHVLQWQNLGALAFIERYMNEIKHFGYHNAPLEIMAYSLDTHFISSGEKINVPEYVLDAL
ncbi:MULTISPECIES: hypothetical protein [unclassified Pseudoalteromonas]|uniref:hypothetical protein n=1 Tax=unclassified Pseudoalteromonas TaxID=194690 RepID=UPI0023585B7A|nr:MULTISPECIES: hypothetical protein [unclassified Pseudoalteromonas]MDC9564283.1 hypothetical protein [Pseudoalteromonas sp. GAB2316C]MDC9568741.1 hypothetical protein [Pseudoalteromonas sp. GABNB9D]MDC9572950.1 hypothetical protein [Pseudoalteromonas sp. GABNS16A]MDC9577143.1 hypothetical protein [Pseudoalteromonas sp. GABNS16E]MDC9584727.1 hypothetical protein [Pseudoalteromonas sp. GABNS16C]